MSHSNKVTVVLGAQWGDEGKGKLVDLLTENMQLVARFVLSEKVLFEIKKINLAGVKEETMLATL